VDVVVNAANSTLQGGGGVNGAIPAVDGSDSQGACREIRQTRCAHGLPAGQAVLTAGGLLRARYVIHIVGPIRRRGREPAAMLASCYRNSPALAAENRLRSIAFPAIFHGAFGYPPEQAAPVVSETIESFLMESTTLARIRLVFLMRTRDRVPQKPNVLYTLQKTPIPYSSAADA
jgi:O-acetyl-ADP-ribose deacetylase